ncbi:MAG: hypothetical protein WCL59_03490, partial [Cyanobium sp. ELA507]
TVAVETTDKPPPMTGRRPSLAALAGASLGAAGCLLNIATGAPAQAKVAFTGYFPASVYWGQPNYNLFYGTGTGIYYIDKDATNGSYTSIATSTTSISFYSDPRYTTKIDKTTPSASGPPVITAIDLNLKNNTSAILNNQTIYKISFDWNFNPFDSRCNGGMATSNASLNTNCSWTFEDVGTQLPSGATLTPSGTLIQLGAYTTPAPVYLASGSSVTFRSAINYPNSRPPGSQRVPAPLPAMGAGAAFGMSRRLRRRLRRSETLNAATVLAAPIRAPIVGRKDRELVASLYGDLLGGPRPM